MFYIYIYIYIYIVLFLTVMSASIANFCILHFELKCSGLIFERSEMRAAIVAQLKALLPVETD
jgi:hypothetical protein